ncbi:MAG: N-6 DNA methylase [Muribaculaceae bacterium]|nr:N-6 DNA methylase [Muribaculaceae bacterium]
MSSESNLFYGTRSNGGQHGDVYTLPQVVRFMLDAVGYKSNRDLSQVSILEPSCGEGEFIVEIANRIIESAQTFNFDANDIFRHNVRAYEIDENKVDKCRTRLKKIGIKLTSESIIKADFLKENIDDVDIVVGNPPYIRYENVPKEMLNYCRAAFKTFHYRCDLYVPFFEKTLSHLKPNGTHCFICSNRWFKNEYGKKLRKYVAEKFSLQSIINIEHANAFQEEVLAYPAITVIKNKNVANTFNYAECDDVKILNHIQYKKRNIPKDSDWTGTFNEVALNTSFQTIEQQGFTIGIGVATGADAVFISQDLPNMVESELIMPGINARDLRGNRFQWQGEYLLNPYKSDGSLVDLSDYPRASAYLEAHRQKLSARHIAKKTPSRWYKTIDRINPTLMSKPKILLPDMSGNTYVFVDDGNFYPLHNIYYITGNSSIKLRLLAAFLMSDFVRNQLSSVTNRMNGGFMRWQSQHLRKLRLPNLNIITPDDVQNILSSYEGRDISAINKLIGKYVYS